jgi:hypothetical protein
MLQLLQAIELAAIGLMMVVRLAVRAQVGWDLHTGSGVASFDCECFSGIVDQNGEQTESRWSGRTNENDQLDL